MSEVVSQDRILAVCRKAYEEHVPRPEDAEFEEELPPEERRTVEGRRALYGVRRSGDFDLWQD